MRTQGIKDLPAVILAGGLGTRLRASVRDLPKVLAPVNGRPFLAYLLDQLDQAGVGRAVLCTGYLGDMVRQRLGTSHGGLELAYSREVQPLGTGGALGLAAPLLEGRSALVLNGDSYCHCDLAAFYHKHLSSSALASMVVVEVSDTSRFGRVEILDNRLVDTFKEKGAAAGPGWINAGIYLLDSQLLKGLPQGENLSLEQDLMPAWLKSGIMSFPCKGPFLDIGTPESYAQAKTFFSGGV